MNSEKPHPKNHTRQPNKKSIAITLSRAQRDTQFEYINQTANHYLSTNQPIIAIDAKKKENPTNFKNKTTKDTPPKSEPTMVKQDFPINKLEKATPYEIYTLFRNIGFENVGLNTDTAEFAITSIKKWWHTMGQQTYGAAKRIYITVESGGSNSVQVKLWKVKLQELANELGLVLQISHLPAGIFKWTKIEQRLYSFINKKNTLDSLAVIVSLVGATTTKKELQIKCVIDDGEYPKGIEASDKQLSKVNLQKELLHGEWNYTINPNPT